MLGACFYDSNSQMHLTFHAQLMNTSHTLNLMCWLQADMNVHEWICALHSTCRHVRHAQHSACMHKWCMRAMNCALICMRVHLCAPALQLPTLASMRNAHSIVFVCVWNLTGARWESNSQNVCWKFKWTLASNSYIVFAIVQVLIRFRKHSSTVLWHKQRNARCMKPSASCEWDS